MAWIGTALLAVPACGPAGADDPKQAQDVLREALELWKSGETVEAAREAGTTVSDPMWDEGFQLERYEIGSDTQPSGFDLRYTVDLWARDRQGKDVHEKVYYLVSTRPAKTVVRSGFESPPGGPPVKTSKSRRASR